MLRPGWVEELQNESIQSKNIPLLLTDYNNDDSHQQEQSTWIKKRGLEYLKDEFAKAEGMLGFSL